jgi:flagellar motor switch protein FliM
MPNKLSKQDIQNLLTGIKSGNVQTSPKKERRKVKEYNFKKALRFSKEHISVLTKIYESFAHNFSSLFTAKLRMLVESEVVSVQQQTFQEFVDTIDEEQEVQAVVATSPLEGHMLLKLSSDTSFTILERMFGGTGHFQDGERRLTEIESMVMKQVFFNIMDCMTKAWNPILNFQIEKSDIEVNSKNIVVSTLNETVIVVKIKILVGDEEGEMSVCLPYFVLQPITLKLTPSALLAPKKFRQEKTESETLKNKINQTLMEVIARLGESHIQVDEFLNLKQGDIIRLNNTIHDQITLKVNGKAKFLAQPGIKRGKVSVQIIDEIQEGDNE